MRERRASQRGGPTVRAAKSALTGSPAVARGVEPSNPRTTTFPALMYANRDPSDDTGGTAQGDRRCGRPSSLPSARRSHRRESLGRR